MSDDRQRRRLVNAMVAVVAERGFAGSSVQEVVRRARASRRTFYAHFSSLEDCFAAVLEDALAHSGKLIAEAFERERSWDAGVREALLALLVFFDANPVLARVWMIEAVAAGTWAFERRERSLGALRQLIITAWRERPAAAGAQSNLPLPASSQPDSPLSLTSSDAAPAPDSPVVVAVMAAVIGVIHTHLIVRRPEPLISLLPPLVGIVAGAYLPSALVAGQVARAQQRSAELLAGAYPPPPAEAAGVAEPEELPPALRDPRAHRARAVLAFVAANPGAANVQVATATGIASRTQTSALLHRLVDLGLIEKEQWSAGQPSAWRATDVGAHAAAALPAGPLDRSAPARPLCPENDSAS